PVQGPAPFVHHSLHLQHDGSIRDIAQWMGLGMQPKILTINGDAGTFAAVRSGDGPSVPTNSLHGIALLYPPGQPGTYPLRQGPDGAFGSRNDHYGEYRTLFG